jgi:hypothetical protein
MNHFGARAPPTGAWRNCESLASFEPLWGSRPMRRPMGARSRLTVSTKASTRARHWRLFACWGGTHTGRCHRKAKAFFDPRLLSWDATRERCLRPRVELGGQSVRPTPVNSTWASHYFWRCRFGNYGASPRFQGKSAPAWTGPRQAWCAPHLRGSAFGLVPGEVLAARIISARTPVPNPRMKTGSRVLDARLMASKFSPVRFPSLWLAARLRDLP